MFTYPCHSLLQTTWLVLWHWYFSSEKQHAYLYHKMLIATSADVKKQFKLLTDEVRFLESIQAMSSIYGLYSNLINLQKMAASFMTLKNAFVINPWTNFKKRFSQFARCNKILCMTCLSYYLSGPLSPELHRDDPNCLTSMQELSLDLNFFLNHQAIIDWIKLAPRCRVSQ